jgi:hypothetical protein
MSAATQRPPVLRSLIAATGVELKLFLREPFTVIFTLGLPVVLLFVLGGVFGDTPRRPMTTSSSTAAWAPSPTTRPPTSPSSSPRSA